MMREGQHYRHLGVPTGFKTKQTPSEPIDEIVAGYKTIDSSGLAPWQKIDAAVTFLNPKLDFILRAAKVAMAPLVAEYRQVRQIVKKWLNHFQRGSAELVYLLPSQGSAGILPLGDQHNILAVVHGFRLLTCPDRTVSTALWYSLRKTVAIKLGGSRRPTLEQLVDYLNGKGVRDGGDIATIWSRVRQATWELKKYKKFRRDPLIEEPELHWHVNTEGSQPEMQILIPRPGEPDISRVHLAVRKQVCHALRDYVRFSYLNRLLCKQDQGKVLDVTHLWSVSNHFLTTGRYTRFADWRFVFRARVGCVSLNGCRRWIGHSETSRQCRKMNCTDVETLPHVLNHCNVHWKAIKLRLHRYILHLLLPSCIVKRQARLLANIRANYSSVC